MNINELRDYRKWIGKSADEVYWVCLHKRIKTLTGA